MVFSKLQRAVEIASTGGIDEVRWRLVRKLPGYHSRSKHDLRVADLCSDVVTFQTVVTESIEAMATAARLAPPSSDSVKSWLSEVDKFSVWWRSVEQVNYPKAWDIGKKTAALLYCLVRWRKPSVILETGVARGASSTVFLKALQENDCGVLRSIDVSPDVGELIPDELRVRWNLFVLDGDFPRRSFTKILEEMGQVDMFFHDSDHSYDWMKFEFDAVRPVLSANGLFCSDDVGIHTAFLDSRRQKEHQIYLMDERKVSGFSFTVP